jgi:hypothetical protein
MLFKVQRKAWSGRVSASDFLHRTETLASTSGRVEESQPLLRRYLRAHDRDVTVRRQKSKSAARCKRKLAKVRENPPLVAMLRRGSAY